MSSLGRLIGGAACVAVGAAFFTACSDGVLPTAPAARDASAEAGEAPDANRIAVLPVTRSHRTVAKTTPGAAPTATPTAGPPAATPTPPPPTATPLPTPTPTPGPATVIRLRAVRWAWQWIQGPGTTPGNPASTITLKGGQTYQLRIFNGDIYDEAYLPHYFSGVFGYISGAPLAYGAPDVVLTFTAPSVTTTTVLGFSCQENGCGPVVRHEGMLGSILVTP